MFKGDQTKDNFLSCDKPIVFFTSIFHLYFFIFLQPILYFWVFLFLLSSFSFFNLSCFHLHIPTFCREITELFFLYFSHLPFNIGFFFVIETRSNPSYSWKLSFFYKCPLVWRVILGRGSERKLLSSKGVANG